MSDDFTDKKSKDLRDFYESPSGIVHTQSRLAVLEKIADSHEERISDIEDFHRAVVERFDQKIQLDATNQVIMERTLAKAVVSLDGLSENLKNTLETATEASKLSLKHEAIGQTVIKFGSFIAILIAAVWSFGTYFHIF
jgi:hypothetical protein